MAQAGAEQASEIDGVHGPLCNGDEAHRHAELEASSSRHNIPFVGGTQTIEVKLDAVHSGWRLDRALAASLPTLSRERLKALIRSGALKSGENPVRDPATKVRGDEQFQLDVPQPEPAHNEPQDIPLTIAYEDEHLLVVDKPAGLVVHPAAGNLNGTLVNALLHHCGGSLSGIGGVARPGIVHRIDKDTSGLLVVAKSDVAHEGLARQFAAHSVDRRYLALVSGLPKAGEGTVDAPLARSSANRKKIAIVEGSRGKRAVTHWKRLEALRQSALVECSLETGRTHQVRVHMASIGHPLLGDPVYGGSGKAHRELLKSLGFHRQALHAARLGFTHPVTKNRLSFSSGMPADMQELFKHLSV
jgi:23S rRNA pseudouridine1911/1915/1917 synthase